MFYTGVPKLPAFLNLYDFISPFVKRICWGAKTAIKRSIKLTKFNLNEKGVPGSKLIKLDEFLIILIYLCLVPCIY